MVKFTPPVDALSEVFKLEASPVEGQSLQQKEKKKRKRKGKKKSKNQKASRRRSLSRSKNYLKILTSAHARVKMS